MDIKEIIFCVFNQPECQHPAIAAFVSFLLTILLAAFKRGRDISKITRKISDATGVPEDQIISALKERAKTK